MTDWLDAAACRGRDDDSFFPISEEGTNPVDAKLIADAKAVCRTCPVTAQCLEAALKHRGTQGVWGGTTGEERRRISRRGKTTVPAVKVA